MIFVTTAKGEQHRGYASILAASFRKFNWPRLVVVSDGPVDGCDAVIVDSKHPKGRDLKTMFASYIPDVSGNVFFIDADCEAIGEFVSAPEIPPGHICGIPVISYNTLPKRYYMCSAGIGFHSRDEAVEFGLSWWEQYQKIGIPSDEKALFRVARSKITIPCGTKEMFLPNLIHRIATNRPGNLPGWFDFDDVYREAVDAAPRGVTMVEVGVWRGKSLAFLSGLGIPKSLKVIGYDQFDPNYYLGPPLPNMSSDQWLRLVREDMRKTSPLNRANVIKSDSAKAASNHMDGSVFFVFLDAGHTEDRLSADIKAWLPKIAPGGILAGHDLDHPKYPGVRATLENSGLNWEGISKSSWIVRL